MKDRERACKFWMEIECLFIPVLWITTPQIPTSDLPTHKKPLQETRAPKHDFSGNLRLLSGMHHIRWFQSLETLPWGFSWIFVSCQQRQITVHEGCHQERLHSCCFKHKQSFLLLEHWTDWRARPSQFCILFVMFARHVPLAVIAPTMSNAKVKLASATVAKGCNFHRRL